MRLIIPLGASRFSPLAGSEVSRSAECVDQFGRHAIWMSDQPLVPGRSYLLKIGTRTGPATIGALKHRIDVETLAHLADRTLRLNEIGFCNLSTAAPLALTHTPPAGRPALLF